MLAGIRADSPARSSSVTAIRNRPMRCSSNRESLLDRDGQLRARLDRDRARRDERQLVRPARLAAHRPASLASVLVVQDVGRLEIDGWE